MFIVTSLTVLKEVMFQDRAMGEILKLLPRLYRFTKIPYAQCTLLKESKYIFWEEKLNWHTLYVSSKVNWVGSDASSRTETNTVSGQGLILLLIQGRVSASSRRLAPLCNMKPATAFCAVSVGSIAIVLFSLLIV